ncbi:hypothetical protein [uncultured Desulfosarcina sp.]|uniref:hypothetical protein n=1 Tax=uncultured Desulfosarcina sp. TaxID=218289 RepID=UPI0029C9510B|nr:hypothetical protein [uncultured Desulfosarcina sp.]
MLTAILPVYIKENAFWSGSRGLKCIDDFLNNCSQIKEINNYIVVSRDDAVCNLTVKYGMEVHKTLICEQINRPYTFEQTLALALGFKNYCKKKSDALLVLDHRNLLLDKDDITNALSLKNCNPESGVISLAFCKDYPCQYKSFYNFLGCIIFTFDKQVKNGENFYNSHLDLSKKNACKTRGYEKIYIEISVKHSHYKFFFNNANIKQCAYIAQVIPFNLDGPQYDECRTIYVSENKFQVLLEFDKVKITGMIVILTSPSWTGEYDTVEVFTPENASWELGGKGATVIDKKKHEPMYSRQQFPEMYTYDGSLCILGKDQLKENAKIDPTPLILKDSCIVNDLVDYYFAIATQSTGDELKTKINAFSIL